MHKNPDKVRQAARSGDNQLTFSYLLALKISMRNSPCDTTLRQPAWSNSNVEVNMEQQVPHKAC